MNKAQVGWTIVAALAAWVFGIVAGSESRHVDRLRAEHTEAVRKAERWEGAYWELHRRWGEAEKFYQAARKEKP